MSTIINNAVFIKVSHDDEQGKGMVGDKTKDKGNDRDDRDDDDEGDDPDDEGDDPDDESDDESFDKSEDMMQIFVKLFARSFSSLVVVVSDLSCFALLPPPLMHIAR